MQDVYNTKNFKKFKLRQIIISLAPFLFGASLTRIILNHNSVYMEIVTFIASFSIAFPLMLLIQCRAVVGLALGNNFLEIKYLFWKAQRINLVDIVGRRDDGNKVFLIIKNNGINEVVALENNFSKEEFLQNWLKQLPIAD